MKNSIQPNFYFGLNKDIVGLMTRYRGRY